MKIIAAEAHRLLALAAEDADLRADLRSLAQEILAATEAPPSDAEAAPKPPSSGAEPAPPAGGDAPHGLMTHGVAQVPKPKPLRELTLGRRAARRTAERLRRIREVTGRPGGKIPASNASVTSSGR
jgi:hypothetical protein